MSVIPVLSPVSHIIRLYPPREDRQRKGLVALVEADMQFFGSSVSFLYCSPRDARNAFNSLSMSSRISVSILVISRKSSGVIPLEFDYVFRPGA